MGSRSAVESMISVRDLSFRRGDKMIFDGVSLDFPRGKISAIMGPSGTGKTTLLRLIGGQLRPDHGMVLVDGRNVHALNHKELYELRKSIGMLFQNGALLTDLNVFENVAFPIREHTRLPESMIRTLVLMKLHAVGLRGARNLTPSKLSGGMARRVALARAIALDPKVILYDEPFTGQDPITKGVLVKLIRELNDALGMTSLVVSHDVRETSEIADQIYVISQGRVIGEGTPESLRATGSERVRQFMSGAPDGPEPFHYEAIDYATDLLS